MALIVEILADAETLRALEHDLRADIDLRGSRLTRTGPGQRPGEMGTAPAALQWITDNNELLAALAGVVVGWLGRQRRSSRITVRLGDKRIELESDRIKDPQATADDLLRRLRDEPDA